MSSFDSGEIEQYDVQRIEDVLDVRYDGTSVSLLEATDRRLQPQYKMTDNYPETLKDVENSSETEAGLEILEEQYLSNVKVPFEVVLNDSREGEKKFTAQRINYHDFGGIPTPNSSMALISEKNETMGFKIARGYEDIDSITADFDIKKIPNSWRDAGGLKWSEVDPNQKYFVQELDLMTSINAMQNRLNKSGFSSVIPQNYIFVEENSDPEYWNSNHDVGIFYEWTNSLSDTDIDENLARQLGVYTGTLDELGLWREDRERSEIMLTNAKDPEVFEIDRERFIYEMNPSRWYNHDWLLQHLIQDIDRNSDIDQSFPSRPKFYGNNDDSFIDLDKVESVNDPRLAELIAQDAYQSTRSIEEDISTEFPENVSKWNPEHLDDNIVLDWFWKNSR